MRVTYKRAIAYFSHYKKPKQVFREEIFDFYKNEGIAFPSDYIRTINLYRKLKMPVTDEYLINDIYGNMAYLTDSFILYCLPILIPHSLVQEDEYLLNMLKRIDFSKMAINDNKMITELVQEMENDLSFFHEHYLYPLCINGLYGFINHMGGLEIEPQFETARIETRVAKRKNLGLFPFISENMKYGFQDDSGEVIIEPKFDYAKPFDGYLASVTINGVFGYTDKYGSVYFSNDYE